MLKLYYDLMSQPSRALYIFLNKTKIPYEKCKIDLAKGGQYQNDYEEVHPFLQVPAIDDGGFKMIESVAIFRYLCQKYNVDDHWYPRDFAKQARVDEYMEWQHANTRFHCALYFQHKVLIPVMTGNPPKQSSIDRFQAGMEKALGRMESHWLKRSKFVGGDEISIADILAVCELYEPAVCGYDCFSANQALVDWHARVHEILDPELEDANVILNKLKKKYAAK